MMVGVGKESTETTGLSAPAASRCSAVAPITARCYQPRVVGQIPIFGHFNFKSREEQKRSKARQNMVSIKTLFGLGFHEADGLLAVRRVLAGEICFSEKMTSDGGDGNSDLSVKANGDLHYE